VAAKKELEARKRDRAKARARTPEASAKRMADELRVRGANLTRLGLHPPIVKTIMRQLAEVYDGEAKTLRELR
jgi:hypothetical protein